MGQMGGLSGEEGPSREPCHCCGTRRTAASPVQGAAQDPGYSHTGAVDFIQPASHSPVHPFICPSVHSFIANCLLSAYCVPVTAANRIYLLPLGAHTLCLAWFQKEESACSTQEAQGVARVCARGELKHRGAQAESPGPCMGSWSRILGRASLKMEGVLVWQRGKSRTK